MNRLKNEISPYLLYYSDNTVDRMQWGDEAFQPAKKEDKPIIYIDAYQFTEKACTGIQFSRSLIKDYYCKLPTTDIDKMTGLLDKK